MDFWLSRLVGCRRSSTVESKQTIKLEKESSSGPWPMQIHSFWRPRLTLLMQLLQGTHMAEYHLQQLTWGISTNGDPHWCGFDGVGAGVAHHILRLLHKSPSSITESPISVLFSMSVIWNTDGQDFLPAQVTPTCHLPPPLLFRRECWLTCRFYW